MSARSVLLRDIERSPTFTDRSKEFIASLVEKPDRRVACIFGDGPAVVFRQMMAGCVALPSAVEQPLCPQHDINRTPLGDESDIRTDMYVVDLSELGGWSRYRGDEPIYAIDPVIGLVDWLSIR